MIIRNKNISTNADIVTFSVSFSDTDVLRLLKFIFAECLGGASEWMIPDILQTPFPEQLVLEYLSQNPKCFGSFDSKWATQLARWALALALRNGFLKPSVTVDNVVYFSEVCVTRKRGRPAKG